MNFAPVLKFVSFKVDDLQYAERYYTDLLGLDYSNNLNVVELENSNKNETQDTAELFSSEGGASLQLVEIDSNSFSNPKPSLLQIGIIGIKIQSRNMRKSYFHYRDKNIVSVSNIRNKPLYNKHFHIVTQDFLFQIKEDKNNFFGYLGRKNGGISGIIIGVYDIEKSKEFYKKVLGYDTVIYEGEGKFDDFDGINGGDAVFKRIVLQQSNIHTNKYNNFFGKNEIELLQAVTRNKIFEKKENIVNPYRFGYFSGDNRDILGNYLELNYKLKSKGNQSYISITDPNGIPISCIESTTQKKTNIFFDLSIFTNFFKHKL